MCDIQLLCVIKSYIVVLYNPYQMSEAQTK